MTSRPDPDQREWPKSIADEIWTRDRGLCVYCLAPALEIDHVVPYSKGGPTNRANGVLACSSCNHRKFNYLEFDFLYRAFFHLLSCNENLAWLDAAMLVSGDSTNYYQKHRLDRLKIRLQAELEADPGDEIVVKPTEKLVEIPFICNRFKESTTDDPDDGDGCTLTLRATIFSNAEYLLELDGCRYKGSWASECLVKTYNRARRILDGVTDA